MVFRTVFSLCAAVAAAAALSAAAGASQLIDRNATHVTLKVDPKGEALITYKVGTKVRHVLAWGAVNAIPPNRARKQTAFKLDYSGGYKEYHSDYWATFKGTCIPYDGPALSWEVAACKGNDGSYWAIQSWQRALPDYGLPGTPAQSSWELRLSHWTGQVPVLDITTDWSYRRFDQIFGRYQYGGLGVFGFKSTSTGSPLDSYGRNIYVDTFDSAYGTGWKRDNSFLTHQAGKGSFCYGFYPHGAHPAGTGTAYRATAEGPGVAPDVTWRSNAPGPYNRTADLQANQAIADLGDPHCRPN